MASDTITAGIELGGTKSIALVARGRHIVERLVIATTTPERTLPALATWLAEREAAAPFAALGIATFGPARVDPAHPDYGDMALTPKPNWSGAALIKPFADALACPIAIDTDVNAAALAEWRWGAGQGCSSLVYLTIGTGLGAGILIDGHAVHGRLHPEAGHLALRRAPADPFAGACPFHGDCAEGLLCGPALTRRFGHSPDEVGDDEPGWGFVAHDLAQLLAVMIFTLAPQRILLGGGVGIGVAHLLPAAIDRLPALLGDYFPDLDRAALDAMIRPAGLGDDAGPMGAVALALAAAP